VMDVDRCHVAPRFDRERNHRAGVGAAGEAARHRGTRWREQAPFEEGRDVGQSASWPIARGRCGGVTAAPCWGSAWL
jgi:hypothetical protein